MAESADLKINIPALNVEAMIAQAVVNSKLEEIIAEGIKRAIGNGYDIRNEVDRIVKQEIQSVISNTLRPPKVDEDKLPDDHPATRLRVAILKKVEEMVNDEETFTKLAHAALGRVY